MRECFEPLEPVLILGCVSRHLLCSAWKLHSPLKAQNKEAQGYLFFEILLHLRRTYLVYVFTAAAAAAAAKSLQSCPTLFSVKLRTVFLTMTPVLNINLYQSINDITYTVHI